MIGRERVVFLHLAQALLPGERVTPAIVDKAQAFLTHVQPIVRIFIRFALLLFEWGTFLFRTAGSVEHFCLLSPRGKSRYIRFWTRHKFAAMRQIFMTLRVLVMTVFYDDPRNSARWVRSC